MGVACNSGSGIPQGFSLLDKELPLLEVRAVSQ
jgi:hypothetical protein